MLRVTKPVVAYNEDIDTWIYFDQQAQVWRYEIYCVGYDNYGESTTLEFVIEEGILSQREFPELPFPTSKLTRQPWLITDYYIVILTDRLGKDIRVPKAKLVQYEKALKRGARQRVCQKLRALGYDVISCIDG